MAGPEKASVSVLFQDVRAALARTFGDALTSSRVDYDIPCFVLDRSAIFSALRFLKEDPELGFGFLTTLAGLHYPDERGRELGVMYQLHNLPRNWRVRLKTFFPIADPTVPSITSLWPAANWMERQEYDFFGIQFEGHPGLTRILNVDDFGAFPMRKEFPLEDPTRDDKSDEMFGR
jgi:NADH-quinone oxidoreductase subunit C